MKIRKKKFKILNFSKFGSFNHSTWETEINIQNGKYTCLNKILMNSTFADSKCLRLKLFREDFVVVFVTSIDHNFCIFKFKILWIQMCHSNFNIEKKIKYSKGLIPKPKNTHRFQAPIESNFFIIFYSIQCQIEKIEFQRIDYFFYIKNE